MNQEQIEQWIAANGGAAGLQYNSTNQRVRNPARMMTRADGTENPDYDPTAPEWIDVAQESWTNTKTGAVLRVSRQPDGGFQVLENKQADPNKPTERNADKPTIGRIEGTPTGRTNPDGTPEYDNTKPIWVERDANGQQVGSAKPLTQQQREQWEREKNGGLTDAEVRARNSPENQVGKPTGNTRKKTENGKTVTETEYLLPDGTKEWRTQEETAPPDRVGKPTGNVRERNEGGKQIKETEYILPDGMKEWRVQETPSTANQPLPAGMPKFTPDPNKPALGLVEYAEQLAALRASGKLTDKQYQEFVGYAHQQASTEASRLDTITRTQQTAQANEINQRNADQSASLSRLSAANSATQNALDTSMKMAGNFTNDTYRSAGGPILPAVMALQDMRAASWGGMNTPPPVGTAGYPALQQVGQMGLTPAQAGNTVIPAVSALAPGGVPAQNGAAIGPVTAGVTATNAAATNPTGANVQAANEATMQGSNAAFGALGIPPAGQAPAQPIFRPMPVTAPVQPTDPQAMQQPGVLPAVNTLGLAAEVAAAGGYSPGVMQMALRELGWS